VYSTLYAWPHFLTENVTMHARWSLLPRDEDLTIIFNSHGGSAVESVTAGREIITRPANPTKTGYDFTGWYSAENGGTEYTVWPYALEGNVTMHAQWEVQPMSGQYTVTFHHSGGSPAPKRQVVTAGGRANDPSAMTKAPEGLFVGIVDPDSINFAFGGWYTDTGFTVPWDSGAPVTKNLDLYAKWTAPFPSVDLSGQPGDNVLAQALAYIATQTLSITTNYTIVLAGGAYTLPGVHGAQPNINTENAVITLAGKNLAEMSLSSTGSLFHIIAGKLILDNNITLKGRDLTNDPLVNVAGSSASLTMKTGAKIYGNSGYSHRYGVLVDSTYTYTGVASDGGSFTMEGGEISDNSEFGVYVNGNGNFSMSGGKISGNSGGAYVHGYFYGGAYVSGSFTMSGGEISSNSGGGAHDIGGVNVGGGVSVDGGNFTMTGGEISGTTAPYGGGVYASGNGNFTMSGGIISGNISSNGSGGGVHTNGSFTMSGGEISGNTSIAVNGYGGGVHTSGSFTMSGGIITDNIATNGGGVYVSSNGNFTMSGGEISGNTAERTGGGVSGNVTMKTGAKISGNTAEHAGGGVHGGVTMEGGEISGNTASGSYTATSYYGGGGVYVDRMASGSSFSKTGGVIYGDTDITHTAGSAENTATSGVGHAVYSDRGAYYRDTTLNAGDNISTDDTLPANSGDSLNNWTKK
jgi:uncharacterized repeat protein (TIGR02543 family)